MKIIYRIIFTVLLFSLAVGFLDVFGVVHFSDGELEFQESEYGKVFINSKDFDFTVFGREKKNFDYKYFQGARYDFIFSRCDIDLRNAFIDCDCKIEIASFFSDFHVYVPENVNVRIHDDSFFSDFDIKKRYNAENLFPEGKNAESSVSENKFTVDIYCKGLFTGGKIE